MSTPSLASSETLVSTSTLARSVCTHEVHFESPSTFAERHHVGNPTQPSNDKRSRKLPACNGKRPTCWVYWWKPAVALAVYAITLGITITASWEHTLFGVVSAELGTWFLAILAKSGDLAFAYAVADAFDSVAWGKLHLRNRQQAFVRLPWFIALLSSTSIVGLLKFLRYDLRASISKNVSRSNQTWRESWRRFKLARWIYARLLFLIILIPGPGIILLADVKQKSCLSGLRATRVSGGLGHYDPSLASGVTAAFGPEISMYVQSFLRDRSMTWAVEPMNPTCRAGSHCKAYLLAGPYVTTAPFPFRNTKPDIGGFKIHNAPFYQVEFWDKPAVQSIPPANNISNLYGGVYANFRLNLASDISDNSLSADWELCIPDRESINLVCQGPAGPPGRSYQFRPWSTFFAISRRTASVTFSRNLLTIQEVTDLSQAVSTNITIDSLSQSIEEILWPHSASAEDSQTSFVSPRQQLTEYLVGSLASEFFLNEPEFRIANDRMKNLLSMLPFLVQPTILGIPSVHETNNSVLPNGYKAENYVRGTYCTLKVRTVPGRGTVIAYAATAGFVLLFVLITKARVFPWQQSVPTEYPLLDYEMFVGLVDDHGRSVELRNHLQDSGKPHGDSSLSEGIWDLRARYVD